MRDEPGDVAHLATRLDFGFSVEVELCQRVIERLPPFLDIAPDEVLHHRVRMMLDGAERQTAQRSHQLFELAGDASVDRPMS